MKAIINFDMGVTLRDGNRESISIKNSMNIFGT